MLPSAGEPVGHELNSHGSVRGVAGASDEPDTCASAGSSSVLGHYIPVPDSFSAGAESTTESPALVRA